MRVKLDVMIAINADDSFVAVDQILHMFFILKNLCYQIPSKSPHP